MNVRPAMVTWNPCRAWAMTPESIEAANAPSPVTAV